MILHAGFLCNSVFIISKMSYIDIILSCCIIGLVWGQYPYPTCSDNSDIGIIFYPNNTCDVSFEGGAIWHNNSIWFGLNYTQCIPYNLCFTNCSALQKCGILGLNFNDFISCYGENYTCADWNGTYLAYSPSGEFGQLSYEGYPNSNCTPGEILFGRGPDFAFCYDNNNLGFESECIFNQFAYISLSSCPSINTTSSSESSSSTSLSIESSTTIQTNFITTTGPNISGTNKLNWVAFEFF